MKLLYFKLVTSLVHDVANQLAPSNISNLFIRSEKIPRYLTRPGRGEGGGLSYKKGMDARRKF